MLWSLWRFLFQHSLTSSSSFYILYLLFPWALNVISECNFQKVKTTEEIGNFCTFPSILDTLGRSPGPNIGHIFCRNMSGHFSALRQQVIEQPNTLHISSVFPHIGESVEYQLCYDEWSSYSCACFLLSAEAMKLRWQMMCVKKGSTVPFYFKQSVN